MTPATLMTPPSTTLVPYRFSVDEYEQMIKAGILEGKRVELIEGQVVQKMTHNPAHDDVLDSLNELIRAILPGGWRVRIQSSITLANSVPEPDVCIAQGGPSHFCIAPTRGSRHWPGRRGCPLYADAGIIEYWIVNIPDKRIEVYTQPSGPTPAPAYANQQIFPLGSSVPLVLGGLTIGQIVVDEILG